jgi:predicted aspartyl protease
MCTGIKEPLRPLFLSAVAVLSTVATCPASVACQIGNVAAIPVEIDRNELLTQGQIDGRPIRVLIDTGSNLSMVWRPALDRLGLRLLNSPARHPEVRMFGLGGESNVYTTYVEELRIQNFSATGVRLPVAGDLPNGIDFIFGEDFLSRQSVEFDLRHHVVRTMETSGCTPSDLPYWAKTYSMADLIVAPGKAQSIRVKVLLNGHAVRAQLDSGSSISLISKAMADAVGLHYSRTDRRLAGIGRGSLELSVADVQSFALGDETINNTQLQVAELGKYQKIQTIHSRIPVAAPVSVPTMLLGLDFLRAHRVLVDNATRKMVFTYEGGPVFELGEPAESN